jgi:hypothetical protein
MSEKFLTTERPGKLLLALASTAILDTGFRGTHYHVFLPHDSWRHETTEHPPPHLPRKCLKRPYIRVSWLCGNRTYYREERSFPWPSYQLLKYAERLFLWVISVTDMVCFLFGRTWIINMHSYYGFQCGQNMVMIPVGLGTKNHCAGEDHQQFCSHQNEATWLFIVVMHTSCGLSRSFHQMQVLICKATPAVRRTQQM